MKIAWPILAAFLVSIFAVDVDAKLVSKSVPYQHGTTELEGYLAYDDSVQGKRPGVLIVHEFWGLNDYVKKRADLLAGEGYVTFAVDMYGKGKVTEHPKEAGGWAEQIRSNIELWRDRATAGLEALKKEPLTDTARIAAIGYCFGGSTVQHMAYKGEDLKGVMSFHGALVMPAEGDGKQGKVKILIAHGAADVMITPEKVQEYVTAMNKTDLDWRMIIYSGAKHSFTNPDADKRGMPGLGYNKLADSRSWADLKSFFKEIF
ncbi:MAG: dienelactone hydrolase family protein [Syntrophobacteraceae bacterium]